MEGGGGTGASFCAEKNVIKNKGDFQNSIKCLQSGTSGWKLRTRLDTPTCLSAAKITPSGTPKNNNQRNQQQHFAAQKTKPSNDFYKNIGSCQLVARLHFAARKQLKRGEFEVARHVYRKALELTYFQYARTFLLWGLLEQRAGRVEMARTLFNVGLRIHPQNDALHCACGLMESKLGIDREAAAQRHLMCAYKLNPNKHRALLNWKRFGLQATPGVLNVSSNSISNSNPYPPATQGAQIEFTTALPFDFQRDDWLTLVEHTYVAAISAATGTDTKNVRVLDVTFLNNDVHVHTQVSFVADISYRRQTEGAPRRKLASNIPRELALRDVPGARLVRPQEQDWSSLRGDVGALHATPAQQAAAARQWVAEESGRLTSEVGACQGWQMEKTLKLVQSLYED